MKKLIAIITLVVILGGGLMGVAMAQSQKLNECCLIRNTFSVDTSDKGTLELSPNPSSPVIVGSDSGACNLGDNMTPTKDWGIVCMLNTIYTVTNWVFYILTLVAVLMIVYGGFVYITAAGDPAKAGSGKSILTFAIIGLAIALIAKLIPSLVKFIIGV
ncbi:MAG: pilin [Candidatus Pacebacteria bacterium]|nr:pilin [Candidatus Paceibacterota bacterium]